MTPPMVSTSTAAEMKVHSPERPSGLALELAAIHVLWRRDVVRFFRQRSRVAGALIQPVLFWLVLGAGLSGTFRMQGAEGLGYMEYFYPGVILMVVLFTSIFATMSLIEDRHAGFLQAVLVGPASRTSLVLGKTLGGTTIAMVQAALFLLLAPFAGFPLASISWPMLLAHLVLASAALTATGFAIAWWLDSVQGYHAVMSVLLLPLWILSGAMFPPTENTLMATVMRFNPLSYAAAGVRRALYGGSLPGVSGSASPSLELAVMAGMFILAVFLSARACRRPS